MIKGIPFENCKCHGFFEKHKLFSFQKWVILPFGNWIQKCLDLSTECS